MLSNRFFIPALMLSVAGHGLLLGYVGLSPLGSNMPAPPAEPIMVHLTDAPEYPPPHNAVDFENTTSGGLVSTETPSASGSSVWYREETIVLNRDATRYQAYLLRLREQIDREWRYPSSRISGPERKTAVIRFSISRQGDCMGVRLLISSGDRELDGESLRAVTSAAPFEGLPAEYNLNRLNVIAEFNYGGSD